MRHTAVALVTALLLVTAGCLGGTAPGADTTTTPESTTTTNDAPTDTTTDTSPTDTTTTTDGALAPGVAANGTVAPDAVLDAHAAALVERGAVVEMNYTLGAGAEARAFDRRAAFAAGIERIRIEGTRQADGSVYRSAMWVNESVFLVRTTGENRTRWQGHERFPDSHHRRSAVGSGQLRDFLDGVDFAVENVTGTGEDRRVTLVSTAYRGDRYANLSVSMVVTGAGVVESLSATGSLDGEALGYDYSVTRAGVDAVDWPEWVADAPRVVSAELSFEFNNCTQTYLTLDHEEGDPLPAGTVVEVTVNETTHRTTLDGQVPRNGSRHLYLTPDGEFRSATERPATENVADLGDEVSVSVVTDEGLLVMQGSMGFGCESASAETGGGSGGGSASTAANR
jgi:hypothetical protein